MLAICAASRQAENGYEEYAPESTVASQSMPRSRPCHYSPPTIVSVTQGLPATGSTSAQDAAGRWSRSAPGRTQPRLGVPHRDVTAHEATRRPLRAAILRTREPRSPRTCLVLHLICECTAGAAIPMAQAAPFPQPPPLPAAHNGCTISHSRHLRAKRRALNDAPSHRVPIGLG